MTDDAERPADITKKLAEDVRGVPASLWASVIISPAIWGLQLQLGYSMVPWLCRSHHLWVWHLLSVVFILATLICWWICYRERSRVPVPSGEEDDQRGAVGRNHFLSTYGMLSCGFFTLVILAQGLASFFINPCWD